MASNDDGDYDSQPDLPVPISMVTDRYLIFDVKLASYLRRKHNICGMTVGTLPQSPSQNLFLGVPVEIMPEEAQLLVDTGVACIVADAPAHNQAVQSTQTARRMDYLARIRNQSRQVEHINSQKKEKARNDALAKQSAKASQTGSSKRNGPRKPDAPEDDSPKDTTAVTAEKETQDWTADEERVDPADPSPVKVVPTTTQSATYQVTPATSRLLLAAPTDSGATATVVGVPASYPLYRHLHQQGYFMTPGLRFGCQYTVYPGDPLRFHSHFLAVGVRWDEEINLMDVVGGGRLGTGVKKGFLLGGENAAGEVRTFSIEWAGM